MKFGDILHSYIKKSIIQNVVFFAIIILIWTFSFYMSYSNLSNYSQNNYDAFSDVMNHYFYHLKYISIIDDEKLLKDINIKRFYAVEQTGKVRKTLPDELFEDKYINQILLFKLQNMKNMDTLILKTELFSNEPEKIYIVSKYNSLYLIGELNALNLLHNSTYYFSIIDESGELILSDLNINKFNFITTDNFRIYLNLKKKWKNITLVTSIDITKYVIYNIFISIIILLLIYVNLWFKKRNLSLMETFEQEFNKIIKSMESFLKELRIMDRQSFMILSENDFVNILEPIKKEKFHFTELEELKEVEFLAIKEMIELFDEISASTEELEATNKELEDLYNQVEDAYNDLGVSYRKFSSHLSAIAEKYDEITGFHIDRVAKYSRVIAEKMGFDAKFVNDIETYAPLHDIGKLMINHDILNKPGGLTAEEYEEMKKHTLYAEEIFGNDEYFQMAKNIALYHHEKYDGSGYPFGLKGEEIPIEARIVALADIYDALRSDRPYKAGYSHEEAYNIIVNGDFKTKPSIFDPEVLEVFKKYHEEFNKIFEEYQEKYEVKKEKNNDIKDHGETENGKV
ncbi:HD-GYP domain-containing protein [Marinitoga sp. 1135]|uniref:HD-GYP domain-containing protein n=1 Tax=Marinitoga sp. 1135 TaxID=1643333 RepID=UPI001C31D2E8|nr:HD-GYP domain-containing protein [Marinitoga sp. 1135]